MGLDISAVSRAAGNYLGPNEQLSAEQQDELLGEDDVIYVSVPAGMEERLDGYAPGFYRVAGGATGFRAGSYSGYNWWRRHLCRMALDIEPEDLWEDPEEYAGQPFVELIDFSDCEGCIGPRTSKKLADDFRKCAADAEAYVRAHAPENNPNRIDQSSDSVVEEWWLEVYREWQEAFELAGEDGFVHFG